MQIGFGAGGQYALALMKMILLLDAFCSTESN